MAFGEFTAADLNRIVHEAAGEYDIDIDVRTMDADFEQLGYDSLVMLETGIRIEREFGFKLHDTTIFDSTTPRSLVESVNTQLAAYETERGTAPVARSVHG